MDRKEGRDMLRRPDFILDAEGKLGRFEEDTDIVIFIFLKDHY